ncbi:MAG: HAD-IA family hydrolase [Pseudonocardiaceae bacterium]
MYPVAVLIEALLFDMDGTLVDSNRAVERAWRQWAHEYGVDPQPVLTVSHGSPSAATVRVVRPDLDDAAVTRAAHRQLSLQYADLDDITATPGAIEALDHLREHGIPWAVVTSADRHLATLRLTASGLDIPPVLVTSEDVVSGKPDPQGYLDAAHRLGIPPNACLVIEDTPTGVAAGRAAGARVAGLNNVPADLQITDLHQLRRLLPRSTNPTGNPRP